MSRYYLLLWAPGCFRYDSAIVFSLPIIFLLFLQKIVLKQVFCVNGLTEFLHEADLLLSKFKNVL
jgi:hypothetical protein